MHNSKDWFSHGAMTFDEVISESLAILANWAVNKKVIEESQAGNQKISEVVTSLTVDFEFLAHKVSL